VRNYRQRKSLVLPVLSAGFCFISAYLYLIIAGRNVLSGSMELSWRWLFWELSQLSRKYESKFEGHLCDEKRSPITYDLCSVAGC
jgi:hypothetical protein